MSSRNSERAALHGPWPSPAEELQGTYGDQYEIHRELLRRGRHGDWIASPLPGVSGRKELRAASIAELADQLRDADSATREESADE